DESDLPDAKKEEARHFINSRLYDARVRVGDRRALDSIKRVFDERLNGSTEAIQEKIKQLKSPVSLANPEDGRLPAEYYRSNNLDSLKATARAVVLNHPDFKTSEINRSVLAAYGGDVNEIHRSLLDGTLHPGMALSDPEKSLALAHGMETAEAGTTASAAEFDRALDTTSRDGDARPVTYPHFARIYDQYRSDLANLRDPRQREAEEMVFDEFLKSIRLVADSA
ncbi:MAG: hypothetical protein DMF68_11555, partial [Acidobacteria bacterium]